MKRSSAGFFGVIVAVLGIVKGKKIRVFKYKRRKDYRRTLGMRPHYSKIIVEKA